MPKIADVLDDFKELFGREIEIMDPEVLKVYVFDQTHPIGHSQMNEILMLIGENRITPSFFQFLVDGNIEFDPTSNINDLAQFKAGIMRFRTLALLHFGNIRFAYGFMSQDSEDFKLVFNEYKEANEDQFKNRNKPVLNLQDFPADIAYQFGYTVPEELKDSKFDDYVDLAKQNQKVYLSGDYLDVYVATSMREKIDFIWTRTLLKQIFENKKIEKLNVRWFDPTLAYCEERIDKGLSEALMLKRAKCTLYMVQEKDTLGKDSELASTLAQGKPVIAFIPEITDEYKQELIYELTRGKTEAEKKSILLDQIKQINPKQLWDDKELISLFENPDSHQTEIFENIFGRELKKLYDARAKTLMEDHPLGIQVNLESGVANGVLVVRDVDKCVKLLINIMLNKLTFRIEPGKDKTKKYIFLIEEISNCVFRIQTGNDLLSNTFWNFYLS